MISTGVRAYLQGQQAALTVALPRTASMVISWLLLGFLAIPSSAAELSDGWSYQEAEAKLGARVDYLGNPGQEVLRWGPIFPGWDRKKQPKAVGHALKVGSQGTVKEILRVAEGKYRVVVHWDSEKPGGPYWSTVIGPGDYNRVLVSKPKPEIVGRWREIGRTATLDILDNGTFTAVDNEGLAVTGRYTLIKDGSIEFAIQLEGRAEEIVSLSFSIHGDELTLTPSDGGKAERYQRQK